MRRMILALALMSGLQASTTSDPSQRIAPPDPVIRKILAEGMEKSELYPMAQTLLDSIGPRLTGSPEQKQANEWATGVYRRWGIAVRTEQYGTWKGWRRGTTHVDLVAPRIRSLEGMLLTWSPGTTGPVVGSVVVFPNVKSAAEFEAWLPQVRGKFVAVSAPEPTCRPDENWKQFATPDSFARMQKERSAARDAWSGRLRGSGLRGRDLLLRLGDSGALGAIVPLLWPQGWGVSKMGSAITETLRELGLSCEDYGLVFRLAENNQGPVLRVDADAELLGDVPVSNVIAEMRGREMPQEYVVLSAHFDSWDAASGATDNGSSTVAIMEAMRILRTVYPNPRRTILAGHWNGEEQGLNGSRAFAADHPDVVKGIQALFNHDNGTGRVVKVSLDGFTGAGASFRRWFSQIPDEVISQISLTDPGVPERGTDNAAFTCHGAPAFGLSSVNWDYETYTWHTNRDTFDKVVFDDLKNNATLLAMLAYLASEDAQRVPREPRVTPPDPKTGQPSPWPSCTPPARSFAQSRY
jgi:carboxypeptidase Q